MLDGLTASARRFIAKPLGAVVALSGAAMLLVGCSGEGDTIDQDSPGEEISVTTQETPTARAESTDPVVAESLRSAVKDPGLGVTFHFQGTNPGNYGGTRINVAITNNNDAPFAPDGLDTPTLKYNTGSGDMATAELLNVDTPADSDPLQLPLDLPLGVGATTNLYYTFEVTQANLWDAEFKIGNVIFRGNLIM